MSNFNIKINLNKNFFNNKLNKSIIYYSRDKDFSDNITFNEKMIIITGSRSKKINTDNFLKSSNNTFYYSIVKTLLFTYFTKKSSFIIEKITISVDKKKSEDYSECKIKQVFSQEIPDYIEKVNCDKLFSSRKKSNITMNALMNLVLSFYLPELKFDYTWKCFNVLIRESFNEKKDHEMLKKLRKDLEDDSTKYKNISSYLPNITIEYMEKCFLNQMICNNYPKNATKGLINFLKDFQDYRVSTVLKNKMKCKKKDLNNINKYHEIELYYTENINNQTIKDSDIIRLIILKYAYYLRCKYFHAEKLPSNFLVENRNQDELDKISIPLSLICKDILENRL